MKILHANHYKNTYIFRILKLWKKALDKEGNMSVIFMDLSKTLDTPSFWINFFLLILDFSLLFQNIYTNENYNNITK